MICLAKGVAAHTKENGWLKLNFGLLYFVEEEGAGDERHGSPLENITTYTCAYTSTYTHTHTHTHTQPTHTHTHNPHTHTHTHQHYT
jgi:hypothetical protein